MAVVLLGCGGVGLGSGGGGVGMGGGYGRGGGEERCKVSVILTLNADAVNVFVFSQCKTLTPSTFYPNFVYSKIEVYFGNQLFNRVQFEKQITTPAQLNN